MAHLATAKRPLIVVLGPTCSGKTGFSIRLAQHIQESGRSWPRNPGIDRRAHSSATLGTGSGALLCEIINGDSRQLYTDLTIGTAKITSDEMQGVPHHLFDVLEPSEEVTIAWYQQQATKVIDDILDRGHVPILVGGSMLYISAVIDGLQPLPPVDPDLRKKLEAEYDQDQGRSLYAKLQEIDPETAAAFHPNNKPYLIRAMEMFEATGEAPSKQKKQSGSDYDLLMFGMQWDRKALTDRIEARTKLLLQNGWIEEVQRLRERGYDASTPAMKSHGYREVLAAMERAESEGRSIDSVKEDRELIEAIDAKTRQYAKRQVTWWKSDARIHWIPSA